MPLSQERGTVAELQKTTDWMFSLPHAVKVMIAGNHDYCLDADTLSKMRKHEQMYEQSMRIVKSSKAHAAGLIYLNDQACEVQIHRDGRKWKIWGSPWSAAFCSMAFNIPRGMDSAGTFRQIVFRYHSSEIDLGRFADLYARIPEDTDILISHGPPYGILDKIMSGRHVGCDRLLLRTRQIQPRLHVWGHIHEDRGAVASESLEAPNNQKDTLYVNAANAGTFHRPRLWGTDVYQPIVVDLKDKLQ